MNTLDLRNIKQDPKTPRSPKSRRPYKSAAILLSIAFISFIALNAVFAFIAPTSGPPTAEPANTIAGSKISGNISGNAVNVTGTVAIGNGGTGATIASGARTNLGLGTIATYNSPLPLANGGTAGTTAATARSNIGAAASGANSDITSLTGLTTPLATNRGGTGLSSVGSSGNVLTSNGTANRR